MKKQLILRSFIDPNYKQASACIREIHLLLIGTLLCAPHQTKFSVSFKDVHIPVIFTPFLAELLISRRCWVFSYFLSPQVSILSSIQHNIFEKCIKLINMAYMVFQLLFHTFWPFPSITPRLFRHSPPWLLIFSCFRASWNIVPPLRNCVIFILARA